MKLLLVALNAKYIHSNPAIYSLRSFAVMQDERAAAGIEPVEYTINQQESGILADLYQRSPDVVAFSCYIWNWSMVRRLAANLRQLLPGVPVWAGGPEVSYNAREVLESNPALTGVMVGEGEATCYALFRAYLEGVEKHPELQNIPGLVFCHPMTGEIVETGRRELTDISRLPFFYGDLKAFENRILYYESSRGCPFLCSYCLSSIDKRVRLRDISLVERELSFFLKEKAPQVKFIDRTFNCNHGHAKAIWRYLLEHDNGVTNFHFEIAADLLDEEELLLLSRMRPGLVQLEIGVQSTNPDTLREIRRYADMDRLRHAVEVIHAGHNIHVHLDLIAGLPYEDLESFQRSFNDVYAMRPHQLQLGFLKVLKGSHMEKMAESYGIASTQEPPYEVLFTKWLSYEDVILLKRVEEMVELFYNSGQFSHVLPALEKRFATPFAMFCALADFYEEKGYFVNSPSRAYRYQVLLDFAVRQAPEQERLYRELLLYDMYLRENLKSRPDFAPDRSGWQEKLAAFYRKEEETRRYLPDYAGYSAKQLQRMTHVEVFSEAMGQKQTAVLFDYRMRDPLTHDARTVEIAWEAFSPQEP